MSEKNPTISAKIQELRQKIARPCTAFETGGFRPTESKRENWIGRVFLCKPEEAEKPVTDNDGKLLYPLAQFYLPDLPHVPEQLRHVTWLTVFMAEEIPEMDKVRVKRGDMVFREYVGRQGKGWLIREYTADDELVRYDYPPAPDGSPKPFPLKPVSVEQDFPIWDGGGLDADLEDEICDLEGDYGESHDADHLDYYTDIGDEHDYRHKFGGYPSFCQSGICRNQGGRLLMGDGNFEFVFQISSDEKACFNVIDNGSLLFSRNPDNGEWALYHDFY